MLKAWGGGGVFKITFHGKSIDPLILYGGNKIGVSWKENVVFFDTNLYITYDIWKLLPSTAWLDVFIINIINYCHK